MTPGGVQGGMKAEARLCCGCGVVFIARRHNQTRHAPWCGKKASGGNRARANRRAEGAKFIGVDGEGVTDPETGEHCYVLLSVGDKELAIDGAQLDFLDIMEFLWSCFLENPEAAYVGFYLKYDFAQWIRTLPTYEGVSLMRPGGGQFGELLIANRRRLENSFLGPFPVRYEGWEFDYLPGKRFKLRPRHPARLDAQNRGPWMSICDVGPYFQTSFLKAIDPSQAIDPVVSASEYALIAAGKARRHDAIYDPEMIQYNQLECDVLARLIRQYDVGIRSTGLRLKRDEWYGPGQVASKWLRAVEAPTGDQVREVTPEAVRDAGRGAYFGGWFETFWHGPKAGKSFGYDINSAYPYIMAQLPCLLHGEWVHDFSNRRLSGKQGEQLLSHRMGQHPVDNTGSLFQLVYARVQGTNPVVGAMLHRTKHKLILRPHLTEGWYWAEELAAACAAGLIDRLDIKETWTFQQKCRHLPPLRGLAELYQRRLEVGKNTPRGRAYRLIYNSAYGKQAQSIGTPLWANPIYASAITSGCRTMVTRAIASHPRGTHDLLMVATDGVVFASRHRHLELDPTRLGAWDDKTYQNLSLFLPGQYWDDADRERIALGEAPIFKSRGVPAKDFAQHISRIDKAWSQFDRQGWPSVSLPVHFQLISPAQAIARGDWSLTGTVLTNKLREVSANPKEKRIAHGPGRSRPKLQSTELVSLPYDGTFGDELRDQVEQEYGDHPEGDPVRLAGEALHDP